MSQEGWRGDPGTRSSARQGRSAGREPRTGLCACSTAGPRAARRLRADLPDAGASSSAQGTPAVLAARALGREALRLRAPAGTQAPTHCPARHPRPQVSEPLAEPLALSRGAYGPLKPKPRRLAPERVSEKGALTSCCPNHLGIPKFKCLSQQRIRTSVFRYLLPFLPVSKFPLRAVPLVKTGHPLRLPPNK